MENSERNNMKELIAAKIMVETKRLNDLAAPGEKPSAEDVRQIPLDDLKEAFEEYGDKFLSDELLNKVLDELKMRFDSFKESYSEGTKLLLAAFPCNINGTLYSEEEIKDGEYLTAFTVNESTGLSMGFGALTPSTHAKMLPEEIQENCSFKVHYHSDTPYADDEDFKMFAEQYTKAYHELRKLLKQ